MDLASDPLEQLTRILDASTSMIFRFDGAGPEILGGELREAMSSYRQEFFEHDVIQQAAFRERQTETPIILHHWKALDWRVHR